jgi:hypothetical protein
LSHGPQQGNHAGSDDERTAVDEYTILETDSEGQDPMDGGTEAIEGNMQPHDNVSIISDPGEDEDEDDEDEDDEDDDGASRETELPQRPRGALGNAGGGAVVGPRIPERPKRVKPVRNSPTKDAAQPRGRKRVRVEDSDSDPA